MLIVVLGLSISAMAGASIILIWRMRSERSYLSRNAGKGGDDGGTTYFLDEKYRSGNCGICLGRIGDESVAECPCGMIFHDACALPTGACPYCSRPYSEVSVRKPDRARCPVCGRYIKGNSCLCGAVLPWPDGTFTCSCGASVDGEDPVCSSCGAVYELTRFDAGGGKRKER